MFEPESPSAIKSGFPTPDETSAPGASELTYPFRLLADETVLGMYPITRKRRAFGKLVSYLFVTDSRVIYSAEAKTFASSSIHMKEHQVPKIEGIEVGRHRGLDALGVAVAASMFINFVGLLIIAAVAGQSDPFSEFGGNSVIGGFGSIASFLAWASLIIGSVVVYILSRPSAYVSVVGPGDPKSLAQQEDLPKMILLVLLFLIFGVFVGLAVVIWAVMRELGLFKASDAQFYADPHNIDRIAFEAGALILDVQARGKLAGQD